MGEFFLIVAGLAGIGAAFVVIGRVLRLTFKVINRLFDGLEKKITR